MSDNNGCLLFVYGTLKRGGRLHSAIRHRGGLFIHDLLVNGLRMVDTGLGYPAAIATDLIDDEIKGELWAIPKTTLDYLDFIEGVDKGLFKREDFCAGWSDEVNFFVYTSDRFNHIQSPELLNEEGIYEWPVNQ